MIFYCMCVCFFFWEGGSGIFHLNLFVGYVWRIFFLWYILLYKSIKHIYIYMHTELMSSFQFLLISGSSATTYSQEWNCWSSSRGCYRVFHTSSANLHCYQLCVCMRVPVIPHARQYLALSVFFILFILVFIYRNLILSCRFL